MEGTKQERVESKKTTEQLKAERQSDATDDEVLREEESRTSGTEKTVDSRTPSPDGEFDDENERRRAEP